MKLNNDKHAIIKEMLEQRILSEIVDKYTRDWRGRFATKGSSSATTQTFTNQIDNQTFKEAVKSLDSKSHKQFLRTSVAIDKKVGVKTKSTVSVVGDTKEWGTEQSILQTFDAGPKTATYIAALKGKAGNQLAVLNFQQSRNGNDTLVTINMPKKVTTDEIRATLNDRGIDFRTINPVTKQVVVLDIGNANAKALHKLSEDYNAKAEFKQGKGDFVGATGDNATRQQATKIYDKIISDYERGSKVISEQSALDGHYQYQRSSTNTKLPKPSDQKLYREIIAEYNKNHDARGRFATHSSGVKRVTAGEELAKKTGITQKLSKEDMDGIVSEALKGDKKEIAKMKANLDKAKNLAKTQQTIDLYSTKGKNGQPVWSEERKALHKQILSHMFKDADKFKPADGKPPTMIMLGGRGGSGKSNFKLGKKLGVYDDKKMMVLNADDIKPYLKEYVPKYAYLTHEESSYLFKKAYKRAKRMQLNVVLDITMENKKTDVLREFTQKGYKTQAHFISTTPANAIAGATIRYNTKSSVTNPLTGKVTEFDKDRLVPPFIIAGSTKNELNFDAIASRVNDGWSLTARDADFNFTPIAKG